MTTLLARLREGRGSFALYIILVSYFWWPSLWHGKLMVFGDAAHHGLSLLAFLAEGLAGQRDLLWDSGIYGGHPLFAESQGGFANPVNLLCALLFTPEYGIGVLHWLNMLIAGAGVYALCRVFGISRWAATFACITVQYSSIWLSFQYNISVTGAMSWLPWLFAAVEYWLNRPTLRRACLISAPAALIIFGGYPHLAYGAAIYLGCYFLCLPLKSDGRALLQQHGRRILQGLVLAPLLAIGLAAIQLLPLTELVTQSHRNQGTGLQFGGGFIPLSSYLRGVLYFDWWIPTPIIAFGSIGSLSACLLAGIVLFLRPSARLLAHAISSLILLNLGMEYASPLFKLLYDHRLIPGLHSFRIMHPFFVLPVIGIALVAAYGLQALTTRHLKPRWMTLYLAAFFCGGLFLYHPALKLTNFIAPTLIVGAIFVLTKCHAKLWLPLLATLSISADALLLRSHIYNFYDTSAVAKPPIIAKVLEDPDIDSYRAADNVHPLIGVFKLSNDPVHASAYRQILDSISPFPSLRWGIPSINGVLALQLARRGLIEGDMQLEISGQSSTPAGRRLIDILGVKYISHGSPLETAGFELLAENPQSGVLVYRNMQAQPKIRSYSQALAVASPEEALRHIRAGDGDHLLIEDQPPATPPCAGNPAHLQPKIAKSSRYLIDVESDCPAWLFIADASYPGWSARINGQPTPLYPAQILGKAVQLPAGNSQVEVRYTPWSFYLGAVISLIALASFIIIVTRRPNTSRISNE